MNEKLRLNWLSYELVTNLLTQNFFKSERNILNLDTSKNNFFVTSDTGKDIKSKSKFPL